MILAQEYRISCARGCQINDWLVLCAILCCTSIELRADPFVIRRNVTNVTSYEVILARKGRVRNVNEQIISNHEARRRTAAQATS
jgi:hypothetical protein